MTKHSELYEVPSMEVVELKYEGVICASGDINASFDNGGIFVEEDLSIGI